MQMNKNEKALLYTYCINGDGGQHQVVNWGLSGKNRSMVYGTQFILPFIPF